MSGADFGNQRAGTEVAGRRAARSLTPAHHIRSSTAPTELEAFEQLRQQELNLRTSVKHSPALPRSDVGGTSAGLDDSDRTAALPSCATNSMIDSHAPVGERAEQKRLFRGPLCHA